MFGRVIDATAILVVSAALTHAAGPSPESHPLVPVLQKAQGLMERMDRDIKDYSCVLVKRERVDGKLRPRQRMLVKLRQERASDGFLPPSASVYLRFFGHADVRGREVLYVPGRHDNKLVVRKGGRLLPNITVRLDPNGPLAMQGNRFSIHSIGIHALIHRLLVIGARELEFDECEVTQSEQKLRDQLCSVFEVVHPVRREHFAYHLARVFIDRELQIPVRFESYDWPHKDGGDPLLLEEYTYLNVKLNVGLNDDDFDPGNEEYLFAWKDTQPSDKKVSLSEIGNKK